MMQIHCDHTNNNGAKHINLLRDIRIERLTALHLLQLVNQQLQQQYDTIQRISQFLQISRKQARQCQEKSKLNRICSLPRQDKISVITKSKSLFHLSSIHRIQMAEVKEIPVDKLCMAYPKMMHVLAMSNSLVKDIAQYTKCLVEGRELVHRLKQVKSLLQRICERYDEELKETMKILPSDSHASMRQNKRYNQIKSRYLSRLGFQSKQTDLLPLPTAKSIDDIEIAVTRLQCSDQKRRMENYSGGNDEENK